MNVEDRHKWIFNFLQQQAGDVDILNSDFVCAYIEATGAKAIPQMFGAPKCAQLGKDLGTMYRSGVLDRYATGLPSGDAAMGFPKWVYSYRIRDAFAY